MNVGCTPCFRKKLDPSLFHYIFAFDSYEFIRISRSTSEILLVANYRKNHETAKQYNIKSVMRSWHFRGIFTAKMYKGMFCFLLGDVRGKRSWLWDFVPGFFTADCLLAIASLQSACPDADAVLQDSASACSGRHGCDLCYQNRHSHRPLDRGPPAQSP